MKKEECRLFSGLLLWLHDSIIGPVSEEGKISFLYLMRFHCLVSCLVAMGSVYGLPTAAIPITSAGISGFAVTGGLSWGFTQVYCMLRTRPSSAM